MGDEKRLERMEQMLQDLIGIVGKTNAMLVEANQRLVNFEQKVDARLEHIESQMYRLQILEKRQNKTSARVETIEAKIEIEQEKQ